MQSWKNLVLMTLLLTGVLPVPSMTASAADMPREGTDKVTNMYILVSPATLPFGDQVFMTFELNGMSRNESGGAIFNNNSLHCLGSLQYGPQARSGSGLCAYTDTNGDQIYVTFDQTGDHGAQKLVGGTGKFAGISGTGSWSWSASVTDPNDKHIRRVVEQTFTWKLP